MSAIDNEDSLRAQAGVFSSSVTIVPASQVVTVSISSRKDLETLKLKWRNLRPAIKVDSKVVVFDNCRIWSEVVSTLILSPLLYKLLINSILSDESTPYQFTPLEKLSFKSLLSYFEWGKSPPNKHALFVWQKPVWKWSWRLSTNPLKYNWHNHLSQARRSQ